MAPLARSEMYALKLGRCPGDVRRRGITSAGDTGRHRYGPDQLSELFEGTRGQMYRASGSSEAVFHFIEDPHDPAMLFLQVRGVRLARLERLELDTYRWWKQLSTRSGRIVSTGSEPLVGDEVWMLYGARAMFIL